MRRFKVWYDSPGGAVAECSEVELDVEHHRMQNRTIIGSPAECSEEEQDEEHLEDLLEAHVKMLDPHLCVIGRQIKTDDGGRLDLLAIDKHGDTAIIELKRGKATRDVIAQVLGYSTWIKTRGYDELNEISEKKHLGSCADLRDLLQSRFGVVPETWNGHHKAYIVAPEFSETTQNIVKYLDGQRIDIDCVRFKICRHDTGEFVSVSPMFDESPDQTEPEN